MVPPEAHDRMRSLSGASFRLEHLEGRAAPRVREPGCWATASARSTTPTRA